MKLTFDLDGYQAGRANKQLQLAQQCFYDPPSDQTNVIFQGNLLGYRQVNRPSSYVVWSSMTPVSSSSLMEIDEIFTAFERPSRSSLVNH